MSPQFVDFDADGRLDIVAATFDGSVKVARGTEHGYLQPVHVLDRDGARIVMNMFWNFDTKKWDETKRCDPEGGEVQHGHLTSAWACDWDGDGDLDMLLGDHQSGQVMVRLNDGSTAEPAFAARNEVVRAAGKPLVLTGTVTTLRLVDVTGDGREDLLLGSMGDAYGAYAGGGIFVCVDVANGKAREFGEPIAWVPPSKKDASAPVRPDSGLYMDVCDHDGDGDLDLVVGGYSHWTPPRRQLTAEQQQRVEELRAKLAANEQRIEAIHAAIEQATKDLAEAERAARSKELLADRRVEIETCGDIRTAFSTELEAWVTPPQRRSFVWLYENVTPKK